jgi:hypothetical protein
MSAITEEVKSEIVQEAQKPSDKEYNFAQIRQQLEREKQEKHALREEVEKLKKIAQENLPSHEESDDDDEPYVDQKKLKKELGRFAKQNSDVTDNKIQAAVNRALAEERQRAWLKNNPDFQEVMQHAQVFADRDPELAETILEMPEGFERQKLVYKNIKALGLHKKEEPKSKIQDIIDQNKRSPYYQPTGIGSAPYAQTGDFSEAGKKNAYEKLKQLKERLRVG